MNPPEEIASQPSFEGVPPALTLPRFVDNRRGDTMGKAIVATDADGLVDVLTNERDAIVVPRRNAAALAAGLIRAIDEPQTRDRLRAAASATGRQYDIAAFVRKMEQLYELLHRVSRATKRRGVLQADLTFLASRVRT